MGIIGLFTVVMAFFGVAQPMACPPTKAPGRVTGQGNVRAEFAIPKEGDLILVPVTVRGKAYTFLLDTGTSRTTCDVSITRSLGAARRTEWAGTASQPVLVGCYSAPDMRMECMHLSGLSIVNGLDLSPLRKSIRQPLDGILGLDVLRHYIIQVDFDQGKLRFLRAAVPKAAHTTWVDLDPSTCSITARVGGLDEKQTFQVDTGMVDSVILGSKSLKRVLKAHGAQVTATGRGSDILGVQREAQAGSLKSLELGSWKHADLWFYSGRENTLGLAYLSPCVITFDFPHRRLYLQKGRWFAAPEEVPGPWGIWLLSKAGHWMVDKVQPASLAAKAGVRANDIIERVNGKPVVQLMSFQIYRVLARAGKELRLQIRRDKQRLSITVTAEHEHE